MEDTFSWVFAVISCAEDLMADRAVRAEERRGRVLERGPWRVLVVSTLVAESVAAVAAAVELVMLWLMRELGLNWTMGSETEPGTVVATGWGSLEAEAASAAAVVGFNTEVTAAMGGIGGTVVALGVALGNASTAVAGGLEVG